LVVIVKILKIHLDEVLPEIYVLIQLLPIDIFVPDLPFSQEESKSLEDHVVCYVALLVVREKTLVGVE